MGYILSSQISCVTRDASETFRNFLRHSPNFEHKSRTNFPPAAPAPVGPARMADAAAIASAASVGLSTNLLGGRYEQGKPYPLEKKLAVAEAVQRLRDEAG